MSKLQFCEEKKKQLGCFKIINISGGFCVPFTKPKINEIINISSTVSVVYQNVIRTKIKGISIEGQQIAEYKVIVMGEVEYDLKYLSSDNSQSLNSVQINIPFSSYISLPNNICFKSVIEISIETEDVYIDQFDGRYGYTNILMMLNADVVNEIKF